MATVLLAGGGTAGHVEPALALAEELRSRGHCVLLLGTATGAESTLVPARGFELLLIDKVVLPRGMSTELLTLVPRVQRAIATVRRYITERSVDVVVGFGGYVALPAYLAARGKLPYVVFSYDSKVGVANRIGAGGTRWRASAQPGGLANASVTGVPLRMSLVSLDRSANRKPAADYFGLDSQLPTLLVFGGSLGAQRLNRTLVSSAAYIRSMGWQVLHIAGRRNVEDLAASVAVGAGEGPAWVTLPYVDRMDYAYSIADFILSRSGAMTCAELACVGVPGALVPYAVGNGEQEANAAPLVASGGHLLILDRDLTEERLIERVGVVMREPSTLRAMTIAAQSYARSGHIRDGASRLADLVEQAERGAR